MSRSFLFIINPVSGGIDKEELINQVKAFCKKESITYEIYYTQGKDDLEKIASIIKEQRPNVMVVAGGDGTINLVTPLLLKKDIKLGLIPAGSANGLASEFGITPDNAFNILSKSYAKKLDIISLNHEKYLLHLADFGLNAMLVRRYEEEGRRGLLGYALSAIEEVKTLREPFQVTIQQDGKQVQYETRFVVIANAQRYGTGFAVNPVGKHGDQKVEICILREISPKLILEQLLEDSDGHQNNFFDIVSIDQATISCNRPVDFQSDGEYWGELQKMEVEVLSESVDILTPE